MHCNIHQADRPLNAVLRELLGQQEQRLRPDGGAGAQGRTGVGQQVQGGEMEAQGQAQPGRDSRLAGTRTMPGFDPHTSTAPAVKVRKGISFPCIPASPTISLRGAQQRLRVAEPTPGTPQSHLHPSQLQPHQRAPCLDGDAGAALASQRRRSFIDVSMATTSPPPLPFECSNHQ